MCQAMSAQRFDSPRGASYNFPIMADVEKIRANLDRVRERIANACARAGRDPSGVRLVAVTKTRSVEEIEAILSLGVKDIGENRVQEALSKAPRVKSPARWHMVGHLQRNKARRAVPLFEYLHSLDSVRLAGVLEKECARAGKTLPILMELNVTGEESKTGLAPEGLDELVERCRAAEHLELRGLMTMAPFVDDPEAVRPGFVRLGELARELGLPELSMGMTNDFEVAVEEGATMVRIGTALFA